MICEYEKLDRLEDSNSAGRDYIWIKAVVFDNVSYFLEKEKTFFLSFNKKVNMTHFT